MYDGRRTTKAKRSAMIQLHAIEFIHFFLYDFYGSFLFIPFQLSLPSDQVWWNNPVRVSCLCGPVWYGMVWSGVFLPFERFLYPGSVIPVSHVGTQIV
ncbi:hypothetical protein F5X96DRAFT_633666 [Biscogniauxia mediterranea]|nr:hypothetical protein F5X96DRAFT_633666 [Biscogniauxia mediterranea]